MKSCISKLKESEEHLINIYKNIANNDILNEQLRHWKEQYIYLNKELEASEKIKKNSYEKDEIIQKLENDLRIEAEKSKKY